MGFQEICEAHTRDPSIWELDRKTMNSRPVGPVQQLWNNYKKCTTGNRNTK